MNKSLIYNFLNTASIQAETCPTKWKGDIESSWSKQIKVEPNNEDAICYKLYSVFNPLIDKESWNRRFRMAVSGSGDERKKITTLHSSSLLALLFFSGVTKDNPISIDQINYNQVFFEIKNKVFPHAKSTDKPSNIDIMLVSDNAEDLLFIESKFTEYLDHGKKDVSDKYLNFYKRLFQLIPNSRLKLDGSYLICESGKNSEYIAGIKQMFSHIIGLATAPEDSNNAESLNLIKNAKRLKIIEVAHKWDNNDEFDRYADFYSTIFGHIDNSTLHYCLDKEGCDPEQINRICIGKKIMTYQEILDQCPSYRLSETIKNFYRFNEGTPAL